MFEFKLPDLGEGLHEAEILKWHVKEGDSVQENQPLVLVLTDKAEVEIPCPKEGKILKISAQAGRKAQVGEVLVVIGKEGESYESVAAASNPKTQTTSTAAPSAVAAPAAPAAAGEVLATPAVRKLAKDLKVDLSKVKGTGPQARITEEDVRKAADSRPSGGQALPSAQAAPPLVSYGPEERVPFRGIRRRTSEKMAFSSRTAALVTHMDEADVTELVALRQSQKEEASKKAVKLTYLPYIIKAAVSALKQFPQFNSSLDEPKEEIVLKKYYNIGIATSTEHGLYDVVIKDCDKKSLFELAEAVEKLALKAKENKLELSDLQGGTFTLTNVGPIGGLFATPIPNLPETAILGIMKIQKRPVVREGQIVVRDMMNLALSFDHRVQDGAEAAEFTNHLIRSLENPRTLA